MPMLTKCQKETLDFVKNYSRKNGYAPSLEDIKKRFKLASVSTAHFHIKRLQEKGALKKYDNQPRAIEVIDDGLMAMSSVAVKITVVDNIKPLKSLTHIILNKIICGDCVDVLRTMPDNSVDMVVTSPPYDAVREYNGFSFNLHDTGKEIFRVLKDGGVAAMVIQDQTKNFGKSLTSFRTIVDWVDNIGFKLFETVIYKKHGAEGAWWTKRFRVDHEYIPIFLKGERPAYFDKEHLKIPSKHGGKTMTGCATRLTNGETLKSKKVVINPMKCRGTLWDYTTCGDGTRLKHEHPATFPDKLPIDLIKCFCPENGLVLDPFIGSGTTALAAIGLKRNYLGIDISKEYCTLAERRIREESGAANGRLF